MSAATREAEQPGKEFQVAEQRLNFKRSQHLHALTQKTISERLLMFSHVLSCSLSKFTVSKFLNFLHPEWPVSKKSEGPRLG